MILTSNRYLQLGFVSGLIVTLVFAVSASSVFAADSADKLKLSTHVLEQFGAPPPVPEAGLGEDLQKAVEEVFSNSFSSTSWGSEQAASLAAISASEDPRLAWLIADLMRFASPDLSSLLADTAGHLLDIEYTSGNFWGVTTDHLIAWDIAAPPDYLKYKRGMFTRLVPGWDKIFVEGDIDWRHVSWGGVLIDDRAFDTTNEPCNCIPAADNPEVTSVKKAGWLKDDDIVFGVAVNGEYRAYPRRIMEVREMVNDTLGGRDLGIPYCTLCGSAQAYFTDDLPDGVQRPVLRTSGLLIRSNKVMYDLNTNSVFDTFRGHAVTGPLAEKNLKLKQASVVTTDWGTWKRDHPNTTVLAESLALGRDFDFRNNRDASGPIFPVGDIDPRLPVHEDVIGVITGSGASVAFPRNQAYIALRGGKKLVVENIQLVLDGGGIRAIDASNGTDPGSHQAFWFAWSQFYPETRLWPF